MSEDERKKRMRGVCEEVIKLTDLFKNFKGQELPLPLVRARDKVKPVIGEGSHYAKVMFVGEAPGKNEAATGRPFCGAAGRVLDELFASIGMKREEVYVTNIVKDRPPGNRDPLPEEIELYAPFLIRQIAIIQPKVIATLGRFSMDYIFRTFGLSDVLLPISKMHGRAFAAKTEYGLTTLLPLYHPAVAIYNPTTKGELKKDFALLKELIR